MGESSTAPGNHAKQSARSARALDAALAEAFAALWCTELTAMLGGDRHGRVVGSADS